MTITEMARIILDDLQARGFGLRRQAAFSESSDLVWLIEPDPSPRGHRLDVDVGCFIKPNPAAPTPKRASDCSLYAALENLPLFTDVSTGSLGGVDDHRSLVVAALDARAAISEAERASAITRIVEPLAALVMSTQTIQDLRARFAEGMFNSAFVHREARRLLSGGE